MNSPFIDSWFNFTIPINVRIVYTFLFNWKSTKRSALKTVCVKERPKKTCLPCQATTGQGLLVNYNYCLKSAASEQPVDNYLCDLVSVAQSVSAFGCYFNMGNRKVGGSNPPGDDTFFPFLKSSCTVDFVNVNVYGSKVNKGGGNCHCWQIACFRF